MKIMCISFFCYLLSTRTHNYSKQHLKKIKLKLFSLGVIYKKNIYDKDYD